MAIYIMRDGRVVRYANPAVPPQPKGEFTVSDNPTKKKVERSTVTTKQRLQVYDTLREWKEELLQTRPKYEAVAARLTTALKFPVSYGVTRRCIEDLEFSYRPKAPGLTKANIYRRVLRLEDCVELLRDALLNLVAQAGAVTPRQVDNENWPERPAVSGGNSPPTPEGGN